MNAKQLIDKLSKLDPKTHIWLASDEEGNDHSLLEDYCFGDVVEVHDDQLFTRDFGEVPYIIIYP